MLLLAGWVRRVIHLRARGLIGRISSDFPIVSNPLSCEGAGASEGRLDPDQKDAQFDDPRASLVANTWLHLTS